MRKRLEYKKPKFKNKIPTVIIMSIVLFAILFFGKSMSYSIASFFAPTTAVDDTPVVSSTQQVQGPSKSGTVMAQANKNAAQSLLTVISKGR